MVVNVRDISIPCGKKSLPVTTTQNRRLIRLPAHRLARSNFETKAKEPPIPELPATPDYTHKVLQGGSIISVFSEIILMGGTGKESPYLVLPTELLIYLLGYLSPLPDSAFLGCFLVNLKLSSFAK